MSSHIFGLIFALMLLMVNGQQYSEDTIEEEINEITRALENAKYPMHRQALENALTNILRLYYNDDYELDEDEKRSIATLAKNGQLPSREPDTELDALGEDDNGHKRNIGSLARSGMMGGKRNIGSVARQWSSYAQGKRNIGALMRNNMFPGGKRNIAALARSGFGKRNVGTLARDWALPKFNAGAKYTSDDGKRNIQSMKNSIKGRKKRDIDAIENPESFYESNNPFDYEDVINAAALKDEYPMEKRFLGRILLPTRSTSASSPRRHFL